MNRKALIFVVVSSLLISNDSLSARGPGGGGRGGGGGGGARPSGGGARPSSAASRPSAPPASRSPAASGGAKSGSSAKRPAAKSTPAARPANTAAAKRPATGTGTNAARPGNAAAGASRPNADQVNKFMDVPKGSGAAAVAAGTRPAGGGAAADFLQQGGAAAAPRAGLAQSQAASGNAGARRENVATNATERRENVASNSTERRENLSENQAGRIENRDEWQQNREQLADEIQKECNDTPVRDFWSENPVWGAFAVTRPFRWASWGAVDSWGGYGEQPASYSYGEDIYYQDGAVYNGDQQIATEEEYAQQAQDLATSAPETPPQDMEWMPLGVFALTQDGQATAAPPTLFMQLVLSKEGVLSGTFENKTSGESQTLEGMVDKTSQRAAWGITNKQRPIVETGLSNLTKDSAPALIHFADGQTQQWLLVRLEEPKQ